MNRRPRAAPLGSEIGDQITIKELLSVEAVLALVDFGVAEVHYQLDYVQKLDGCYLFIS
jgi:hypothetical protein